MEKIKSMYQSLKMWHKMVFGAALLAIVTGVLLYFTLPDKYVVVYQNLNDADKQEITVELSKLGVDYRLGQDGSISVPTEDASWVRQEMTGMGLPFNSKSGEEILLESSLGSSEQDKKMKQIIGTQKQLEQDIVRDFQAIESANVQLTLPEKETIFDEEKAKGTAAVTVGVKNGQTLTEDQVVGIQHMISAAVPGVKAEEVSVIDSKKGVISKGADSASSSGSSYEKELELQQKIEDELKQDIESTLTTIFQLDEFKINTKVNVNFDEVTRQSETYGDDGVLRSKQEQEERSTAKEGADGQAAGIEANGQPPNYGTENSEDGAVTYDQQTGNKIENYEIDKTIETVKKHPELTKTNVVVWVDNTTLAKRNIDIDAFKQAIGTAAGLQTDQDGNFTNGQVNIVTVDFEDSLEEEPKPKKEKGLNMWLIGSIAAAVLLIGGIVTYFLLKRRKQEELEEFEEELMEEISASAEPASEREEELVESTEVPLDEQVKAVTREHVEATSKVIKKWLNE